MMAPIYEQFERLVCGRSGCKNLPKWRARRHGSPQIDYICDACKRAAEYNQAQHPQK